MIVEYLSMFIVGFYWFCISILHYICTSISRELYNDGYIIPEISFFLYYEKNIVKTDLNVIGGAYSLIGELLVYYKP